MAALFAVLLVYQLPIWIDTPKQIFGFVGVIIVVSLLDTVLNTRKTQKIQCGVSASVTVGILYTLFPRITFFYALMGAVSGITIGKHLFGGTGRNVFNPAMIGAVCLSFFLPVKDPVFDFNPITVSAMILSLPFVVMRPYAALGLIIGMLTSMSFKNVLDFESIITSGMLFWSCLVITDPVTITYRPFIGAVGGIVIGFLSMHLFHVPTIGAISAMVLILNLITSFVESKGLLVQNTHYRKSNLKTPYKRIHYNLHARHQEVASSQGIHKLSKSFIINKLEEHEVAGLGGAGYPTHLKVKSLMDSSSRKKILIVNAVECDPGLVHDTWILMQYQSEIVKGIQVLCQCAQFDKVLLATKENIESFAHEDIEVIKVPNYYPAGSERELIKLALGMELSKEDIPTQLGILVLNVQTVLSVYEVVCLNKKNHTKFITIANLISKEAQPLEVSLGSKISDVMESVYDTQFPLFAGGGLMQSRAAGADERIEKTTNFLAISHYPRYKDSHCSKCGICVKRCPQGLEVYKIADIVDRSQYEKLKKYNPDRCISCGICSYYCLAGKNLSEKVKKAKVIL